jgi:hypothetical protein
MKSAVVVLAAAITFSNALPIDLDQLQPQRDYPKEIWRDPAPTATWGAAPSTATAVWASKPSSPASAAMNENNQVYSPNPRPKSSSQTQQSQQASKPEPHIIVPIAPTSANPRPSNPRPIVPMEHDSESITEDRRQRTRPQPNVIMPQPSNNKAPDPAPNPAGLNIPEPQRKPEYKPDHAPDSPALANDSSLDDVIPVFSIVGKV